MRAFATLPDGRTVEAATLAAGDLTVEILTYGAILLSVRHAGVDHDLTWTPDRFEDWTEGRTPYHGAIVGPVANRITGARTTLDGRTLAFPPNQATHFLHSGPEGLHTRLWQVVTDDPAALTLALDLADGDGGFPGNRRVTARFSLAPPATLRLEITGETDAPTFFNCTNHSYWCLAPRPGWQGHGLQIAADRYLPTDDTAAPTGEIAPVEGTPMDFRTRRTPAPAEPPLDHNFCLSETRTDLRDIAWLDGPSAAMTIATTECGLQVYDGRDQDPPYPALALEAQGWPDAPNRPDFPSVVTRPGETYRSVTEWRFTVPPR
ncbi:aldose epimerase family protein [Histidinibacterium lentulum]|uniref:Galactose mutarotase n=1 Tax=Histidinibacterium lentulum TaxID=2480588 RepID=A0A3N2R138_9RHOB|nr:aldose epimerase family protein [Histidinibacterium lentulum]ROU01199.1 galactose mutarotase [Histidinibacterium lentulum]